MTIRNPFLLLRLWRPRKPPADLEARRVKAKRYRQEAFGEITDESRAEDRQRLADAQSGKGELL